MFFRKERKSAAALSSLMAQTRDTMVCFEFIEPVDPKEPQEVINRKLRNSRVIEASRSFARYFGFQEREEVLGQHLLELFHGEIPEWFIDYGNEVEDRDFENIERQIKIPVGDQSRTTRIYMQNIFDGDLLVSQWITIRDVSEEEKNKKAVEQNEQLKLLALESVGLQTFELKFDLSAGPNHGEMVVGGQVIDDWWSNIHSEDQPLLEQAFTSFFNGESPRLHTLFRTSTDRADVVWMESWATATNRDADGKAQDVVGVVMDRTQSKALEAQLIASQRLESLGVMAGGIAHDFNNLLMSITGSLDLITHSHPEIASDLAVIERAATQASMLCDQLLTYAGRGSADLKLINITSVVNGLRDITAISTHKNAKLRWDIDDDFWIKGDSSQVSQVLLNLVKNASDAFEGSVGHITIAIRCMNFQEDWRRRFHLGENLTDGTYVALEVRDDGVGIGSAKLERLFDPFFTTKFTGRGLGLAVVMGIVRGHGGAIQVESTPGKGTVIRVVFEHQEQDTLPRSVSVGAPMNPLSGRILVVDDEESVRRAVGRLLSSIGVEPAFAESGEDAIAMIEADADSYSAVLMDVTMPGMDGVEAASQIMERYPQTNIIMCSGYSQVTVPPRLADKVDFLQKPYRLEQLHAKLVPMLTAESV